VAGFGNGCQDRIDGLWEDCLRGVFNAKIADKLQAARERLAAARASGVEATRLDAAQGEADGGPAPGAAGEGAAAAPTASKEEQARLGAAKQARLKTAREKKAGAAAGKAKREQVAAALKAAEEETIRKVAEQDATRRKKTRQRRAAALEEAKERRAGELKAVEEEAAALKANNKLKQAAALKEAKQKQAATLQAAYDTAQAAAAQNNSNPTLAATPLPGRASASSTEPLFSDNDNKSNSTLAAASDGHSSGGSNATEALVPLAPGGASPTAEVPAALEEAKERQAGELKAVEEEAAALKANNKPKQATALKEAKQKQVATLQAAYDTAQAAAAQNNSNSTLAATPLPDRASASSTEPLFSDNDNRSNSTLAAASDGHSSGGSNATDPLVPLVPGGASPTAEVPAEVPGVAPTRKFWSHMFKVRDSWDAPRFWRACTILERLPDGAHELLFTNGQNITASAAAVSINLLPYDMRLVDCLVVPAVVPAAVAAALPAMVPVVVPAVVLAAAPAALPAVVPPAVVPAALPAVMPPVMAPAAPDNSNGTTMLEPAYKRARHHNTDEEQRQQPKHASLAAGTNLHPWSQLQKHILRQPVPTEPKEPNGASARCSDSYSSGRNGSSQADSSALGSVEPSAQQSAEPASPAAAAWPRCISCGELLQSVPFRTCIWCNSHVHTVSDDDDKWQCYLQLPDGNFSCESCALGHSTGL
jgi:hypothetical protein